MQEQDVHDVITRYFDCVNNDKWDALRDLWHEQCVTTSVEGVQRHGVEEVMALYPELLAPFPTHFDDPRRILVSGDSATVEIHFTGTMDSGRTIEFDALDVFDLQDDKIHRLRYWYNPGPILADITAP